MLGRSMSTIKNKPRKIKPRNFQPEGGKGHGNSPQMGILTTHHITIHVWICPIITTPLTTQGQKWEYLPHAWNHPKYDREGLYMTTNYGPIPPKN